MNIWSVIWDSGQFFCHYLLRTVKENSRDMLDTLKNVPIFHPIIKCYSLTTDVGDNISLHLNHLNLNITKEKISVSHNKHNVYPLFTRKSFKPSSPITHYSCIYMSCYVYVYAHLNFLCQSFYWLIKIPKFFWGSFWDIKYPLRILYKTEHFMLTFQILIKLYLKFRENTNFIILYSINNYYLLQVNKIYKITIF